MMEKMTKREMDVMDILWNHMEEGLSASDIMNLSDGLSIYTIQQVLRSLLKRKMISVSGIGTNKTALMRLYKPVYTKAEYIRDTVSQRTMSDLAAAFVSGSESEEELDSLLKLIQDRKNELKGQ